MLYRTRDDSLLGDMGRISWGDGCLLIPGLQSGFLESYQSYSPVIHNPTFSLTFTVQIHLVHAFIFAKKHNGNTCRSCYGISAGEKITPCSISSVEWTRGPITSYAMPVVSSKGPHLCLLVEGTCRKFKWASVILDTKVTIRKDIWLSDCYGSLDISHCHGVLELSSQ